MAATVWETICKKATVTTVWCKVAQISMSGNANGVCHLSHHLQQTYYFEGYYEFVQVVCGCALCSMFILCGTIKIKP
jgi:hypothetical protein